MQTQNKNQYRQAYFEISVSNLPQLPTDQGMEIAFVGRSNSGKSSAINTLTENKQLARTSKTPGRTQLINFFCIDNSRRLVDLPGYGYAKVGKSTREHWDKLIDGYLRQRKSLVGLVLLMDIRHPLKEIDEHMLAWCHGANVPVLILLTKSDKISASQSSITVRKVKDYLVSNHYDDTVDLQTFSATTKKGLVELIKKLDNWFGINHNESHQLHSID